MKKDKNLIAGIIALLLVILILITISTHPFSRHAGSNYILFAKFNQTSGLEPGAEVRLAGIKIGKVNHITLDQNFKSVVELKIPQKIQIPDDSSASVVSINILGGKYIEIVPGGSEDNLQNGDFLDFTQDSPELPKLIDKMIAVSKNKGKN